VHPTNPTYSGPDAAKDQYAAVCAEMARYHAQLSDLLRLFLSAQSFGVSAAFELRHLAMCLVSLANEIEFAVRKNVGAA
jgi:hypothetical protein